MQNSKFLTLAEYSANFFCLIPVVFLLYQLLITGPDERSVVLADQVKSLDWVARRASYKGKATPEELADVCAKIFALIG